MKIHAVLLPAAISLLALCLAPRSSGQIVYQDDFDSGFSGGAWSTNQATSTGSGVDSSVDFAFNYSSLGIPAAPNSLGTTIGMRFLVNQGFDPLTTVGTFQGISASPTAQIFNGDFRLRFDMWINFVGPFPGGGNGSTQMASFGWGTSGTTTQWAGAKHSVMFAASGDGGTGQDYRAYLTELAPAAGAPILPSNPANVYPAGNTDTAPDSRNNLQPYYAPLGGKSAPGAQLLAYPNQTGTTADGTLGMAWRDIRIEKNGNIVTWFADDLLIATVPFNNPLGGENIFFGMFDINATASTDPNDFLNAAIYDNIRVEVIPEPTSAALFGLAAAAASMRRRRAL